MYSVSSNAVAEALGYLVWENPNISQDYSEQNINFDRVIPNGYEKIRIEAKLSTSLSYAFYCDFLISYNGYLGISYISGSGVFYFMNRIISNISTNGLTVGDCRFYGSDTGFTPSSNSRCIPTRIWAIK